MLYEKAVEGSATMRGHLVEEEEVTEVVIEVVTEEEEAEEVEVVEEAEAVTETASRRRDFQRIQTRPRRYSMTN